MRFELIPSTQAISKNERNIANQATDFINHPAVQGEVAQYFAEGNRRAFDASFGDDGCQARALGLTVIFAKDAAYAELPIEDQLYLTLCHILHRSTFQHKDRFGLEFEEEQGLAEALTYQHQHASTTLTSFARTNIGPGAMLKVMGRVLSRLSVALVRRIGDHESEALQAALKQQSEHHHYLQVATTPTMVLLYHIAAQMDIPLVFTFTRLLYCPSQPGKEFHCEVGEVLMYLYDATKQAYRPATEAETQARAMDPCIGMDGFAVHGEKEGEQFSGFAKTLDGCKNFESFKACLATLPLEKMSLTLASRDDESKGRMLSEYFREYTQEGQHIGAYTNRYALRHRRTGELVPLEWTHIYAAKSYQELRDAFASTYQGISDLSFDCQDYLPVDHPIH